MKKVHIGIAVSAVAIMAAVTWATHSFTHHHSHNDAEAATLLTLGDYKTSTIPKKGYIFTCGTHVDMQGGGAGKDGPWIGSGVWDPTKKLTVDGSIVRSGAAVRITTSGNYRVVIGNGLPVKSPTGIYPVQITDDAYQYDRNPNKISKQTVSLNLPRYPALAKNATCVGGGGVGITLNGVTIFDGLDAMARDAVAHEVQDDCSGHPEKNGTYHYHSMSKCFKDNTGKKSHSNLMGYALDGFGIYGYKGENGKILTNADLDECHGHTHTITWEGKSVSMYHYHATAEYPYTVGCFRGTPVKTAQPTMTNIQNQGGQTTNQNTSTNTQSIPQEPLNACKNKSAGAACSFKGMNNETISDVCVKVDNTTLVCGTGPKK